MSKPNLLGFSSSIGIYRNKRIRELRKILSETVKKTVKFCDLSPMLFQALMAYAAENQIDGDFSRYSPEDFSELFASNHIPVTVVEAEAIQKALESTGLIEGGKIRSWSKFNRHLGEYEKIVKSKRKAARRMHQLREKEQKKAAASPAPPSPEKPAPEKAAPVKSPVARVISIEKLMKDHPGAPNASNEPQDPLEKKMKRMEFRSLKLEMDRLNAEIAGVNGHNPVPA